MIKLHENNEEKIFPKIKSFEVSKPINRELKEQKAPELSLIEIKKIKWYERLAIFIKNIFVR